MEQKATGIILAGGKSSRMGTDKGLLPLKGKAMITYVIDALKKLNLPTIIVANNPAYLKFGLPVFEDEFRDMGPVAGIYTGLKHSDTELNIILSCDIPFVSEKLLRLLLNKAEDYDVVLCAFNNQVHPLIGMYKKSTLSTFERHLKMNQRKLMTVCNDLTLHIINLNESPDVCNEQFVTNINTPDELKRIEK